MFEDLNISEAIWGYSTRINERRIDGDGSILRLAFLAVAALFAFRRLESGQQ